MEILIFALFALLALVSSLVVVAHKSPIYSTLSLVVALFAVAVLFVLLGAPFIATLQLLIYAGAILVLFLFVIMLLNVGREEGVSGGHQLQLATALVGGVVLAGLLAMLLRHPPGGAGSPPPLTQEMVSLAGLAQELFAEYLLPFEIVGVLLLAAVIGATVVARRPTPEEMSEAVNQLMDHVAAPPPSYAAWAEDADHGATPASVPGGAEAHS
jgi:NADH-quinone oxidoreductase subunit J